MTETPTLAQQLRATVKHDMAHGFPPDHRVIEAAAALEAQAAQIAERDAQIEALRAEVVLLKQRPTGLEASEWRADAERYRWLCATKIRPIYRPGHPKIEHYIDGQTIGWQDVKSAYTYKAGIDAAIDAAMAAKEPR